MKKNGRRQDKRPRRSSAQFTRVKYSNGANSPYHQHNNINDNLSIAMPLSIENVRFHNQKSLLLNNRHQSTMCETPSSLRRCKSLPQSHTLTPTPYAAIASPRDNETNEIPFISEDVGAHSVNSASSYPSLLALKLSFTNHASANSPAHPPQLQIIQPPIGKRALLQNGEEADTMQGSSDSSFYNNDDDIEVMDDDQDDDDVLHPHETRKQSTQSQRIPPTPRTSNNHHKKRHHSHIIQQNMIINSDKSSQTKKRKTLKKTLSPQKRSAKHRFLSATSSNSLIDDEDKYDPPQASMRLSVSTPITHTSIHETKKEEKVHGIKVTKVPRNGQYPTYATALQSVVEEVAEQTSLEQHLRSTNKSKPSINTSDASKEYHQYKQRQQAFNQIINHNKQQIKHNTNSMNMNVNININNDSSIQHNSNNRYKRKKRLYNKSTKSKSSSSSSLVITKNKKKRHKVDIRRPQTTRRVRVSSPMLNIKHKRHSNHARDSVSRGGRMYRYELNSDETSDILSDTTMTSTQSSITSISNDTSSANITHSDAHATKGLNTMQRSSSISISNISNKKNYPRRPVTIIRRAANNKAPTIINPMMRASSAMYSKLNRKHKKIGLFDNDSLMTSQLTPRFRVDANSSGSGPSGWEFLERDKFFLESKYRSYAGSEISFDYENMDEKLSSNTNFNHDLCKKEVHDAYERGFLAGYFLGVNIMQQQLKDKDINHAIAK